MKLQKQPGFAHLMIITVILGLGLVGTLGFVFYQNVIQKKDDAVVDAGGINPATDEKVKPSPSSEFTDSLDKFTAKTLIGSDSIYDVYILDNESSLSILKGNVLVYSKSIKKAMEINKAISIFEAGIYVSGMERQGDDYLVIDSGTGPDRTKHIILLANKDVIEVALVVGGMNYWNNHYIYTASDNTHNNRPYGSGNSLSIFSLNMSTKLTSKIMASTSDNDYIASSIAGSTLNYSESSASNPNTSVKLTLDLNSLK